MASDGQNTASLTGGGGFFALAASVLCCYEHIITFGEEVRCVWGRRISGASALFLVNRYATLTLSLAGLVQVVPWNIVLPKEADLGEDPRDTGHYGTVCSVSLRLVGTSLVIASIAYTVFASLRMFALYNMSKSVFVRVLLFGLLNPAIQIFRIFIEDTKANPYFATDLDTLPLGRLNCLHLLQERYTHFYGVDFQPITGYAFISLRAHAVIFEGILIGLTWRQAYTRWSVQRSAFRTPYTTIFLRDGTCYFLIIALTSALNMAGAIFYVASGSPLEETHMIISVLLSGSILVDAITSICMSRFILSLLAVKLDECATQLRSSQWRTLCFATVVETAAASVGPHQYDEEDTVYDHETEETQ